MPNNMVALFVAPADRAKLLALLPEALQQYAQPADQLHLTLYHWEGEPPKDAREWMLAIGEIEQYSMPLNGKVQGWGVFEKDDERVLYASFDHPGIATLRGNVIQRLPIAPNDGQHGFTPHITLAYLPKEVTIPDLKIESFDLTFDRIYLASNDVVVSVGIETGVQEIDAAEMQSPFDLAKSVQELPNGDLEIIVKGVPFKGPKYLNGKDLDGEYFDKNTDIGGLPEVLSYFHHAKDPIYGKELIGKAQLMQMDPDEGWFYRIIVDKRAKYRRAIKALAEQNMLGASSTPFQRSAEKSADGHWNRWHVIEVSLTYSPAHPEAEIQQVIEKSIGDLMEDTNVNQTPPDAAPNQDAGAGEATLTLAEQIEKAFETAAEKAPAAPTVDQIVEAVMAKLNPKLESLEKSIGDVHVAIPLLAQKMAGNVKKEINSDLGKSSAEKTAEEAARRTVVGRRDPNLPADAPGNW